MSSATSDCKRQSGDRFRRGDSAVGMPLTPHRCPRVRRLSSRRVVSDSTLRKSSARDGRNSSSTSCLCSCTLAVNSLAIRPQTLTEIEHKAIHIASSDIELSMRMQSCRPKLLIALAMQADYCKRLADSTSERLWSENTHTLAPERRQWLKKEQRQKNRVHLSEQKALTVVVGSSLAVETGFTIRSIRFDTEFISTHSFIMP